MVNKILLSMVIVVIATAGGFAVLPEAPDNPLLGGYWENEAYGGHPGQVFQLRFSEQTLLFKPFGEAAVEKYLIDGDIVRVVYQDGSVARIRLVDENRIELMVPSTGPMPFVRVSES